MKHYVFHFLTCLVMCGITHGIYHLIFEYPRSYHISATDIDTGEQKEVILEDE